MDLGSKAQPGSLLHGLPGTGTHPRAWAEGADKWMHLIGEGKRAWLRTGPGSTQLEAEACGFDPRLTWVISGPGELYLAELTSSLNQSPLVIWFTFWVLGHRVVRDTGVKVQDGFRAVGPHQGAKPLEGNFI